MQRTIIFIFFSVFLIFSSLSYAYCDKDICSHAILLEENLNAVTAMNAFDFALINVNNVKQGNHQYLNVPFIYHENFEYWDTMWDTEAEWNIINANEDWFHHDAYGNRIYLQYHPTIYIMNIGNEGYIDFRLDRLKQRFDTIANPNLVGFFHDNFHNYETWKYTQTHYDWRWTAEVYPMPSGEEYYNWREMNVNKFKQLIPNKLFIGNSHCYQEVNYILDGCMSEEFLRRSYSSVYPTEAQWVSQVGKLRDASLSGKIVLVVSSTPDLSLFDRDKMYTFASFLLAKRTDADYYFYFGHSLGYPTGYQDLDIYHVEIGQPIGNYYKEQNVYRRQYTSGLVLVNPTNIQYTVNLGENFQKLDGTVINQLTLKDHEGIVLFKITTTPQNPLTLSNIQTSGITNNSAIVTWSTNRNANSTLLLGLAQNFLLPYSHDMSFATQHNILISNLGSNTTFYYKVKSCDSQGVCNTSDTYSFRTLATTIDQIQCIDNDLDGYGINCTLGNDCNDNNASINPASTEICGNNIDEDCSGTDEQCAITCGNGIIDSDETCSTCPLDAGCSGNEICIDDICVQPQCTTDTDCDDDIQCTQDSCVEFSCHNTQIQNCEPETLKELYVDEPENIIEGAHFTITVLDEKGKSVRYAYISYGSQEKTTNVLGKASFLAESGEIILTIKKFGYRDKTISITSKDFMTKITEIIHEDPILIGLFVILSAVVIMTVVKSKSTRPESL